MWLVYALPMLLLVAAVVLGLLARHRQQTAVDWPVLLAPVDAPQAGSTPCGQLLAKLPTTLDTRFGPLHHAVLATPAPPGAAAWTSGTSGPDGTAEPVVLRCGLPKPPELAPTSELIAIDKVGWLVLSEPDRDTFVAVDRAVYIALTVPHGLGTGPVQIVSNTIASTLSRTTG